jgi:prepilin-type processing-associated H-X9-DG protein
VYYWGVGDPRKSPHEQPGSYLYAILPYFEQQAMFQNRAWPNPVKGYVCPSRRLALAYTVADRDNYGAYEGGGWAWGKADYAGNAFVIGGVVVQDKVNTRILQVTDGTSNTILAGEKAFDPGVQTPTSWYWDEPFFLGGSGSTARAGLTILRDGRGIDYRTNWGSPHAGGAQFLFADGSVRVLSYATTWQVLSALLTPAGGEPVEVN